MTRPIVALIGPARGVETGWLVYHLSWMYAELGVRVLAADFDPRASLTATFLEAGRVRDLWFGRPRRTVHGGIRQWIQEEGAIGGLEVEKLGDMLAVVAGDPALFESEDAFSSEWRKALEGDDHACKLMVGIRQALQLTAAEYGADIVLVDVTPYLGAISRAVVLSADHMVFPLTADLYSWEALRVLGGRMRDWTTTWQTAACHQTPERLEISGGPARPTGYIVMQRAVRLDRSPRDDDGWMGLLPNAYLMHVLGEPGTKVSDVSADPHCLAQLKDYQSLIPMAQEARKPIFLLKPADGAIGAHSRAVQEAYADFRSLAWAIAQRTGISIAERG